MPKRFKRKADRIMRQKARSIVSNSAPSTITPTTEKKEENKEKEQSEYREVPPAPDIPKIKENVLKKKKSLDRIEKERRLGRLEKQKKMIKEREKTPEKIRFLSPEKIVKDFRKCYLQSVRMRQVQYKYSRQLPPESTNKLALLVRIRGYPNRKTVRDLIYKRGKTKIKGKVMNLRDNTVIEEGLGEFNVVCIEDIVHSIFECDENFQKVG